MAKPYSEDLHSRARRDLIATVADETARPLPTVSTAVAAERLALVRTVMISLFVASFVAALPTWLLYAFLLASELFP